MVDAIEMLNGDCTALVNSPHLVANCQYLDIIDTSRSLVQFNKYKFITIRPHIQFMLGRYFSSNVPNAFQYSKKLLKLLIDSLQTLGLSNSLVAGSVDRNKDDIGTHIHCILNCSLRNYELFKKNILPTITMDHMIGHKKQYAIKISKCMDSHVDKMVRYYIGIRAKAKKIELIYQIKGYNGSASNVLSLSEYDAHLLSYKLTKERTNVKSNQKQTIIEMENFSDFYLKKKTLSII